MMPDMDTDRVVEYFRGKNILITGSTGFLGKVLLEKILRVQPDVKKLFLLVRATDVESAKDRMHVEVTGREIFQVLKEKHGMGFDDFIEEKLCPLAGDIMYENFGLDDTKITELSKEINIIVNGAATTNFHERYDVAMNTNALGMKHVCAFANKCTNLKMLLHVSTAYVAGEQEGVILETPFSMGEALREGTRLDIDSELNLIKQTKIELNANNSSEKDERRTMKELGLMRARQFGWPNTYVFTKAMGEMLLGHMGGDLPVVIVRPSIITSILKEPLPGWMEGIRTIDTLILGYAKQAVTFFPLDPNAIMDVIPGDMVVNAMMVAMAAHSEERDQTIYHVTSSIRNPASYTILAELTHRYLVDNPPGMGKNGDKPIRVRSKMHFFSTFTLFCVYMVVKYKFPLEILHLVSIVLGGVFSQRYNQLNRKYNFVMHLVKLYAPYSLFKGRFDDMNTERLRILMGKQSSEECSFDFDPKSIDWDNYFYKVHIPGVFKYLCDRATFN